MKVFHSISEYTSQNNCSLTVGTFDGVHLGHLQILDQLVKTAKKYHEESVLFTFFPHPRMVLQKELDIKLLNTIDERIELLSQTGLDNLIIVPFNKEFSRLSAVEFVRDILVNQLKIKHLIIGYDHHFGRNREGTFDELVEYGNLYGFDVLEISAQDIENVAVSSTKIRNALNNGDIEKATKYLNKPYMITGEVVRGKGVGNKIGFPTANIYVKESYKLIPRNGVYIINTFLDNHDYNGIMNIGYRPTLKGKNKTIEVHLLDFNDNLYSKNLQINLIKRIRDEKKFSTLNDLKHQIQQDEIFARKYINSIEVN